MRSTARRTKVKGRAFQRIFESNFIGMTFGMTSGYVCEVNEKYASLLGYTRAELEANPLRWEQLTPLSFHDCHRAHLDELLKNGTTAPYEKPCLRKDGSQVWVLVWFTLIDDPKYDMAGFIIDISDRKGEDVAKPKEPKPTLSLEAHVDRLLSLFRQAPALICILKGPDFTYEVANDEYLKMVGGRDIIGKPLLEAVPGFDRNLYGILREVYRTGERFVGRDFPVLANWTNDGPPLQRFYTFVYEPIFNRTGEIEGICVLAVDVSQSKQMEAKLQLSQRLASLGTMAAGIGHEINNPLAYAILNLGLIKTDLDRLPYRGAVPTVETVQARLDKIQSGLERIQSIVKGLRTFSHSELIESNSAIDVHECLNNALDMAFAEIHHRAQVAKIYGEIPLVKASPTRLGQVFLNLLINAAQAIPIGRASRNLICIRTFCDLTGAVNVQISDSGEGIAPDALKSIFDPFFTTKPVGTGTGLGLSICHGIVASLGGDIQVESELKKGTTVTVVLPCAEFEDQKTEWCQPEECSVALKEARILLIDDEECLIESLSEILSNHYDVECANSGSEAFRILQSGRQFDLILCDLMLPDTTGMDLFDEIKRQMPDLEKRMVFVSGGAFTPRAEQFLKDIPNQQLMKPFRSAELFRVVRDALSLS